MNVFLTELELPEKLMEFFARSKQPGRLLAIDMGAIKTGVAISDEMRLTVRSLDAIPRKSWKDFLLRISALVENNDIKGLVIGLPLNLDGTAGPAAANARRTAEKFRLSLSIPVYLQDERLTTFTAEALLKQEGRSESEIAKTADSTAAAIILRDFIASCDEPNHR